MDENELLNSVRKDVFKLWPFKASSNFRVTSAPFKWSNSHFDVSKECTEWLFKNNLIEAVGIPAIPEGISIKTYQGRKAFFKDRLVTVNQAVTLELLIELAKHGAVFMALKTEAFVKAINTKKQTKTKTKKLS